MNEIISRRRKVFFVPEEYIKALFSKGLLLNQFVRLPTALNLPEGTKVLGCHHDWQRNAFGFAIEHESFEEVEEGVTLPEIRVEWLIVQIPVNPLPIVSKYD